MSETRPARLSVVGDWSAELPLVAALGNSLECGLLVLDETPAVVFASETFGVMVGLPAARIAELGPRALLADLTTRVNDPPRRLREGTLLVGRAGPSVVCEEFTIDRPGPSVVRWVARRIDSPRRGQIVVVTDITAEQRLADSVDRLHKAQSRLMELSRRAGMAEVATSVLHNVGNVLNSVNVSVNVITDRLRQSRRDGLGKAVRLLRAVPEALAGERCRQLGDYLALLETNLGEERDGLLGELGSLQKNVDHVKRIVAMQQDKAGQVVGVAERTSASAAVEDAVTAAGLGATGLVRDYQDDPKIDVDRQKLLQVLVNLFSNARDAVAEAHDQTITARVRTRGAPPGRFVIEVIDRGCGIAPERLTTIFQFGVTSKPSGHGFGLHGSANLAREMGGSLTAHSDGPGRGARFVIELPLPTPPRRTNA